MCTNNYYFKYHPLIKFFSIILLGSMSFMVKLQYLAIIPVLLFSLLLLYIGDYKFSIGMFVSWVVLLIGEGLIGSSSLEGWILLSQTVEAFRKVMVMIIGARVFFKTTEIMDLIKVLEKMKVPSFIVLPLAVTLRFIPTIRIEYLAIKDAMKVRGISLGWKDIFIHPNKKIEYLLVPLLMRSARISDELSATCITRGINSIHKKTSYKNIRIAFRDYILILVTFIVCAGMQLLDYVIK